MQTATVEGTAPDVIDVARHNDFFRRVIATGEHEQVVVMTLEPGMEIGSEIHPGTDQVFMFIEGSGTALLDEEVRVFDEGDLIFVRAGTRHNIFNTGTGKLRLITIYAPPEHASGTVHRTKADAELGEYLADLDDERELIVELA